MSDLFESLKTEFQDKDYRYAYAESFLNTKLAAQIKTLREQRRMTQAQVASEMGITQPGYRRFEDVNHAVWRTDSLWNIARALGVRLDVSFKTFGTLPDDKRNLNKESLQLPIFEDDPAFNKEATKEHQAGAVASSLEGGNIISTPSSYGENQRPDSKRRSAPKRCEVIPFPRRFDAGEIKRRAHARRKLNKTA